VFPVHGVGGMTGTLLAGVFASTGLGAFSGQGYAPGMAMGGQLLVQATGVAAVAAYTAAVTFVLLKLVDALLGLRVSAEGETVGLDTHEHNETGYNL
jgi:Amt family ammonium transporter